MLWSLSVGYSSPLILGYVIEKISVENGFSLQPKARQKCMCVRFLCVWRERGGDISGIPFVPGTKVVALNWIRLALVSVKCTWELLFFPSVTFWRGWLQYMGLCFHSEAEIQCTLQVLSFCSGGCGKDRGHPHKVLLTGRWCFLEEWNYTKREKRGALLRGRGVLKADLGIWKQRKKFILGAVCGWICSVLCFPSSVEGSSVHLC